MIPQLHYSVIKYVDDIDLFDAAYLYEDVDIAHENR